MTRPLGSMWSSAALPIPPRMPTATPFRPPMRSRLLPRRPPRPPQKRSWPLTTAESLWNPLPAIMKRPPITTPPTPLIMTALWVTGSLTMPARTVTRRFWKLEPTIMSVCSTAAAARNTRPWTSVTSSSPPKPAPRLRATRAMRTSRPS